MSIDELNKSADALRSAMDQQKQAYYSEHRTKEFFDNGRNHAIELMWTARRNFFKPFPLDDYRLHLKVAIGFQRWYNAKQYIRERG